MFPLSTQIPDKFIAKEKFYSRGGFTSKMKIAMTSDVAKIVATNKLSADTLNVDSGKSFPEIMVLKISLKKKDYEQKLIDALDKNIRASYVLFIIEFEDRVCASIGFKEKNGDNISIVKRWTSDWANKIDLNLDGRTIDQIYEGLIRQVSDEKISKGSDNTLKEKVVCAINTEKIERQIQQLYAKMTAELQLKKKLDIKAKIKKLEELL